MTHKFLKTKLVIIWISYAKWWFSFIAFHPLDKISDVIDKRLIKPSSLILCGLNIGFSSFADQLGAWGFNFRVYYPQKVFDNEKAGIGFKIPIKKYSIIDIESKKRRNNAI